MDDLVKSQKSRHSWERMGPELLELTGFPLSREWLKWDKKDFLRDDQILLSKIFLKLASKILPTPFYERKAVKESVNWKRVPKNH